jgi:hypothetical protein
MTSINANIFKGPSGVSFTALVDLLPLIVSRLPPTSGPWDIFLSFSTSIRLNHFNFVSQKQVIIMLFRAAIRAVYLAAAFSAVDGAVVTTKKHPAPESVGQTAVRTGPAPIPTVLVTVKGGATLSTNVSAPAAVPAAAVAAVGSSTTVQSTVLIFARDTVSAYSAFSGLNAYGIPYQVVVVPQAGITLPALNSSATVGNYGAIVILSEVSYNYGGTLGYQSALTTAQLAQIYAYQAAFGVRMVRLDSFPSADSGTVALGGCCGNQEQTISISNAASFLTAGLNMSVLPIQLTLL